ncbi:MAG TPA: hypothetical protein VE993_14755 [Stellaceae bacterium]|nr:hypothetical protein [Stellaceae bacterium]
MPTMNPSPAELRIIRSLVIQNLGPESPFLNQISALRFPIRHLTGTGYFIEFDPLPEALRAAPADTVLSTDLITKLAPPRDLVGFTLFINGGFMTSFEGYTFGDVRWPEEAMEDWLVFDTPAISPRSD